MRAIKGGSMNSARIRTVTAVTFIVAFAPVLCELAQQAANSKTGNCSGDEKGQQDVDVTEPNTTVTLKCNAEDAQHITPPFEDESFNVCTQEPCKPPQLLSDFIPGATGKKGDDDVTAIVHIDGLPPVAKTFYVQCGEEEPCYIVVKVAQAPSPPGGDTTGGPLSCADPGKAITIKIPQEGSTAQFTCGTLTLYPRAADRVFAEDCKKEENLKNIVRSGMGPEYTLTADKKPPKKKWCYLCARSTVVAGKPGQASDYCLVHVESSSRLQSASAIALAAVLPCVLAMLRIT